MIQPPNPVIVVMFDPKDEEEDLAVPGVPGTTEEEVCEICGDPDCDGDHDNDDQDERNTTSKKKAKPSSKEEFSKELKRLSHAGPGNNPFAPAATPEQVEKVKQAFHKEADRLKAEMKAGIHRAPKHLDEKYFQKKAEGTASDGYDGRWQKALKRPKDLPASSGKWFKVTSEGYYISYQNGSVYFVPAGSSKVKELIVHAGDGWSVEPKLISKQQFQSIIDDKPSEAQLRSVYLVKEIKYFDEELDYNYGDATPLW